MEFGNIEFNNGLKKSIYAYNIKEIHILSIPLSLKELKEKLTEFVYKDELVANLFTLI